MFFSKTKEYVAGIIIKFMSKFVLLLVLLAAVLSIKFPGHKLEKEHLEEAEHFHGNNCGGRCAWELSHNNKECSH
jgi:hypothetical protein